MSCLPFAALPLQCSHCRHLPTSSARFAVDRAACTRSGQRLGAGSRNLWRRPRTTYRVPSVLVTEVSVKCRRAPPAFLVLTSRETATTRVRPRLFPDHTPIQERVTICRHDLSVLGQAQIRISANARRSCRGSPLTAEAVPVGGSCSVRRSAGTLGGRRHPPPSTVKASP